MTIGIPLSCLFQFYRQHREIIALFSYAHKGVDSIRHVSDDLGGFELTIGYHRLCNTHDAFISKLGMIDVLGFVQAIGEEEDGGGSL